MKVLVNGRLIGRSEASIDLEDRGYQFGDGIYEVIRVYKGVLFGLREHAERFFRSAAEIGISLPFSIEDLEWDLQKLALPHLQEGCAIINTTSITAYEGDTALIDYSSTKGAIVSFTRSMAKSLADKGIRVNAVAPGPIWTPLIPATFPEEKVKQHGLDTPMGRPGQPVEHAGAYVLLASDESSYMTGQTIHVNGGRFIST